MFSSIKRLKNRGYAPDTILDIGACQGYWTRECRLIYDKAQYYLFEAINYEELKSLESCGKGNIKVFNVLLNNKTEEVDWYELKNTGDSMFKELTHYFSECEPVRRMSTTLSNVVVLDKSEKILMKIDCQGAEIPILMGTSSDILEKTDFIILEMPFFGQYNKGTGNFLEHIQYMDSIGFIPYEIVDNHVINGFNMQIDMLFINKNHEFNKIVQFLLNRS
jgi:FkbM family methyltransferase